MNYFLPTASISRTHGQATRVDPYLLYPVYHPAAALRQASLAQVLRDDFRRIPEIAAAAERPAAASGAPAAAADQPSASQLQLL